jgi:hypothetical protein
MTGEYDLEAARFFMKLERMLNEMQDEEEIARYDLRISDIPDKFCIHKKEDDEVHHIRVLGTREMSGENKENINPSDMSNT